MTTGGYFTHLVPTGSGDLDALCGHRLGKNDGMIGVFPDAGPVDCDRCRQVYNGARQPRMAADDVSVGLDEAAVTALRVLVSDWEANGNSRALGDPTAATWHACALQLLTALDALAAVPRPATQPEQEVAVLVMRLPECLGPRCAPHARRDVSVFHPGHALTCPRYVPNVEHFCADCGEAVNYATHRSWCRLAAQPAHGDNEAALREALTLLLASPLGAGSDWLWASDVRKAMDDPHHVIAVRRAALSASAEPEGRVRCVCMNRADGRQHDFLPGRGVGLCGDRPKVWDCGPHMNAWKGHDVRCRRVAGAEPEHVHDWQATPGLMLPTIPPREEMRCSGCPAVGSRLVGIAEPEDALRAHRREWADWLENWDGAVCPEPPTMRAVIDWLRADSLPFGVASAEPEGGEGR